MGGEVKMFQKITLKNGLRVITVPMVGSKTVTILILVATGSKYETKEINGISHFLEHLFFKGTKKRPSPAAISEELDKVGGEYNAFTSKEYTGYWAKVDFKHLDLILDWTSDIFLNSKLKANQINKEKKVIVEEINMYFDTPIRYVGHLWEELLYGDQPAGWFVWGTKETISKLRKNQLLKYLTTQYLAPKTVICLAGHFNQNKAINKIEKYFKKIKTGQVKEKPKLKEKQRKPEILVHFKETDQTHLCLGVRGYNIFHPDRYALGILGTILGGFMSSRLWQEIREKRSLAYYLRTLVENDTDSGYLVTQAGVANAKVDSAIKIILTEYQKVKKKISQKELIKAKEHIKGNTLLNLETSDEMASFLAGQEIFKKEILRPDQFFKKIDQVQINDLLRVAQDIFRPEKLNLALIGPFKEKEKFKKLLKI